MSRAGHQTPMAWSACEELGDGFIHVATVAQPEAADHPTQQSSERVLTANTLRTTGAVGGA